MVGYLTNWVALKLIFRPIHPTPVCCGAFVIQGAFLRRQKEVSEKFSKLNVELFCNAKKSVGGDDARPAQGGVRRVGGSQHARVCGHHRGASKPAATFVLGSEAYDRARNRIADGLVAELPKCVPCSYDYQDGALEVEKTVCDAMKKLPPDEFEGVLHPVFEEDEIAPSSWGVPGRARGVRAVRPAVSADARE